jgi:hypothetical protein
MDLAAQIQVTAEKCQSILQYLENFTAIPHARGKCLTSFTDSQHNLVHFFVVQCSLEKHDCFAIVQFGINKET